MSTVLRTTVQDDLAKRVRAVMAGEARNESNLLQVFILKCLPDHEKALGIKAEPAPKSRAKETTR